MEENIPVINKNDIGPFRYSNLCDVLFVSKQPFVEAFFDGSERLLYLARRMTENRNFIVSYAGKGVGNDCNDGIKFREYGLKFHICLREDDRELFDKGWNFICAILMKHSTRKFKVIGNYIKMSESKGDEGKQAGKDVTVYADENPNFSKDKWCEILQEINQCLVDNNIPPGYRQQSSNGKNEHHLMGSNYISYRYEVKEPEVDFFEDVLFHIEEQMPNLLMVQPILEEIQEQEIEHENSSDEKTERCCC